MITFGIKVRTGVFVANEWRPMCAGIVVGMSSDGSVANVDIMSLHGGAAWVVEERVSDLIEESSYQDRLKNPSVTQL